MPMKAYLVSEQYIARKLAEQAREQTGLPVTADMFTRFQLRGVRDRKGFPREYYSEEECYELGHVCGYGIRHFYLRERIDAFFAYTDWTPKNATIERWKRELGVDDEEVP